ncbi:hypothetical protein [Mesorhizobium argentiipisi]|uniref:hypothetical protein n=1 Tax=Mesorhizobium argentiipisi TaxID=3015175 RepID=UPI00301BAFAD
MTKIFNRRSSRGQTAASAPTHHFTLKPSFASIERLSLKSFRLDLAKASPKTV